VANWATSLVGNAQNWPIPVFPELI